MNDSEQSSENYRPSDSSRIEWFTTDWPDLLILLCHQPEMIFRILVPDFTLSNKFGAPLAGVEQPLEREALHWNYQLWEYASFHCGSGDVMIHKHTLTFSCLPRKPHKLSMNGIKSGWPWNWMPATRHWWRISFFDGCKQANMSVDILLAIVCALIWMMPSLRRKQWPVLHWPCVTLLLKELSPQGSHVNIISEPGRYFVKAAYALCSQIYRVLVEKDENDVQVRRHYHIVHGVQEVFEGVMLCEEESIPIPLPNGYSTTRN